MRNYSGWVIAGVICLILITLAVTGIVSFSNNPSQSTPTSSQAIINAFENSSFSNMRSVPLRMVA